MFRKLEIPKWISPPRQGTLRCIYVGEGSTSMEFTVQFKVNGHTYTSFVPTEAIDQKKKEMSIHVIGSLSDGSYLVDLPSDTLISGTRIKVPKDDPELIHDSM